MAKEKKTFVVSFGEVKSRVQATTQVEALQKVLKNKGIIVDKISIVTPAKKK